MMLQRISNLDFVANVGMGVVDGRLCIVVNTISKDVSFIIDDERIYTNFRRPLTKCPGNQVVKGWEDSLFGIVCKH